MSKRLVDLFHLSEDERVRAIANFVAETKRATDFMTDAEPGKPERYIKKLLRYPHIEIISQTSGPVPNVVTIRVGYREDGRAERKELSRELRKEIEDAQFD